MREPKEKKCIFCGGHLWKHGLKRWQARGAEVIVPDYECSACRKRSVHYVGQVIKKTY